MKKNHSPRLGLFCAALAALCSQTQAFAAAGTVGALYTVPNSTFIESAGGGVFTINDSSGSISTVQTALNNARAAHPSDVIVVNLNAATYSVSSAALTLGSHVCLVLSPTTTIKASSSTITSTTLVQIGTATNVSVAGGIWNVNGADANAVRVQSSSRVNLDKLTITAAKRPGIYVQGKGNTVFDNENTITRCDVSGSAVSGIKVVAATQAVVSENNCHNNTEGGIYLADCARSTVFNNTCNSNGTGILVDAADSVIANNHCELNPTGLSLSSVSANNVIASNYLKSATTGINSAGTGNTFYDNFYSSGVTTRFVSAGTGNNVIAYKGALSASGQNYFYPPTIVDNHAAAIMNGKARFDLTVGATTISSVQSQYNSARSAHPNDVIVLHLTGATYTGNATLTLGSNTCVILSGTIDLNSGVRGIDASNASFVSISGGVIDGGNTTGREGIHAGTSSMISIDRMTLQNFGAKATRIGGSDVIHFSGGSSPYMVGYCTINGGAARGIWSQLSGQKAIYTDNDCSNVNMDGIDLDSHTKSGLAKLNNCHDNVRYGVFIEQGALYDQALANTCTSNGRGVNIYDNLADTTNFNTAAFNRCNLNGTGIRVGSLDATTEASHNFLFNNVITNSTSGGVNSETNGTQNYWSQQFLSGNGSDYGSIASAVFFNSSDVP
jgi:parallel beta-helix repeat protein